MQSEAVASLSHNENIEYIIKNAQGYFGFVFLGIFLFERKIGNCGMSLGTNVEKI